MDIEGFEYDFLAGASLLLSQKRIDIIQIEINEQIRHSGRTIEELLELLNSFGYSLCRYDVNKKELLSTSYDPARDNYFSVADIKKINTSISARP